MMTTRCIQVSMLGWFLTVAYQSPRPNAVTLFQSQIQPDTAANGTHALRARARDGAQHVTISEAVAVTVSNTQGDTTRPPVPPLPNLPTDSTFTVKAPGYSRAELLYFRNIAGIIFDDTTSGATIRQLLNRYGGTIIGGVPGVAEYVVQMPDPGHPFAAVDSLVNRLNSESGVALARKMYYRTPVYPSGDHPKD